MYLSRVRNRRKSAKHSAPGIARAMAEQWGGDIRQEANNAQL